MTSDRFRLYVISARRPANVPVMAAFGVAATWVVPQDEAADYRYAGATSVLPVPDGDGYGLPLARNMALDHAFDAGVACVQSDDDLRWLKLRAADGVWRPAPLLGVINHLLMVLDRYPAARLAGIPPTPNTYFAHGGVHTHHFVIGSLCVVLPSEPRFDVKLPLKEDYDFTCQHLEQYGCVARTGNAVADYRHYANKGGAVAYRTDELEHQVCDQLLARWPKLLRPNGRRPHELVVRPRPKAD